jgi:hypothetical protein
MTGSARSKVWLYDPSVTAAVMFLLLFLGLTMAHCWRIWQTKAKFCIAFAFGGVCMSSLS